MEIWKPIKNYEGLYEVSSLGNIRSLDRFINGKGGSVRLKKGELKAISINTHGYAIVSLYKNNARKTVQVHRVVAEAFIPNLNNYLEVNHKDENKLNNTVNNLEWCTRSYNCKYSKIGSTNAKPVVELDSNCKVIKVFSSVKEVCETYNLSNGGVSDVCTGKRNSIKGNYLTYEYLSQLQ